MHDLPHGVPRASRSILAAVVAGTSGFTACALIAQDPPLSPGISTERSRATVEERPSAQWETERQIRVQGGDPYTRTQFRVFFEELREDFRRLLFPHRIGDPMGGRDLWKIPIQLTLWGDFRDVHLGSDVQRRVEIRPDQQIVLNVDVKLHDRFEEDAFQIELIRTLLLEQILTPYASQAGNLAVEEVQVPEWIVQGLDQVLRHRRGGRPSASYRGYLESGQLLKPQELLEIESVDSLDPVRLAVYRASASAMVEALLGQPDGDLGFRGLLAELVRPVHQNPEALLRQHFPAFREMEQGLEKWWALELAALGQQQSFEYLDPRETERLLSEALILRFDATPVATPVEGETRKGFLSRLRPKGSAAPPASEPFVGGLEQFEAYLKRAGAKDRLAEVHQRLQHLKRVGFPLYRPVFVSYERAVERLVRGETKGLAEELAAIEETRGKIRATLERVTDSLNHFEAARAPLRSNAFDGYLKMSREFERRPRPSRNDAITRQLDALEREFR